MTRKLHDVAQDVIINEEDCGTVNGIWVKSIMEGEDEIVKLTERIVGRVSCEDINDPSPASPSWKRAASSTKSRRRRSIASARNG
jgi:DNA-directed RNA polymerase subunit beta'